MDSKAEKLTALLLGELLHGEKVDQVILFNFLHIGAGEPLGKHGVGNVASKNLLFIVEGIGRYMVGAGGSVHGGCHD